jgi:hypothetical protein
VACSANAHCAASSKRHIRYFKALKITKEETGSMTKLRIFLTARLAATSQTMTRPSVQAVARWAPVGDHADAHTLAAWHCPGEPVKKVICSGGRGEAAAAA